jgi:signal transduction histidine kinase
VRPARVAACLAAVLATACYVVFVIAGARVGWVAEVGGPRWVPPELLDLWGELPEVTLSFATALLGTLLALRRPTHPIPWLLVAIGVGYLGFPAVVATVAAATAGGAAPGWVPHLAWVGNWMWIVGSAGTLYLLLLFPDGRLLNDRWRLVARVAPVYFVTMLAVAMLWPELEAAPGLAHPLGLELGAQAELLRFVSGYVLGIGGVLLQTLGVVCLVLRFVRSTGIERQQMKWMAFGVAMFGVAVPAVALGASPWFLDVAHVVILAAVVVAVTRYRLYDIDLVISRTVVYGILAAFITAVYVAVVVGLGNLVGTDPESSPLLAIGAIAVIAFAFGPLRERVQRLANRMVYGRRATPYEVLSAFSSSITAIDEPLLGQVARSLVEGTTAVGAAVWVADEAGFSRVAVWPEDDAGLLRLASLDVTDIPGADVAAPVVHDGQLLGAVSLVAAPGQTLLGSDEQLLEQLAAALGLVLRNLRLGEDVQRQVDALHRSRQRIVAVQDETRRGLERDLHDGAQQRLVAIKVKLGLARIQAETAGAGEVAELLGQLAAATDSAVDALRDFARGIYPPVLEAEGLGAALASQVQRLPIPVTVHAAGMRRQARAIEAAVYFCVLEALQNVVKHAAASSAHVALHEADGVVRFEVSDDGCGFDPVSTSPGSGFANLADRLDALDGSFDVDSSPGSGTTVRGQLSSRAMEPVS